MMLLSFLMLAAGCRTMPALTAHDFEAVRAAEAFVVAYGYTSQPPTVSGDRLRREINDAFMSDDEIVAYRHDYLEPRAVGIYLRDDYWHVIFRVTDRAVASRQDIFPFDPIGRDVMVDMDLNAGIAHSWVPLSDPEMIRLLKE